MVIRPTVKVTKKQKSINILEGLNKLKNEQVLVGITQEKASRSGEHVNNAELAFLHSGGFKAPKYIVLGKYKARLENKPWKEAQKEPLRNEILRLMQHGSPYWNVPARPFLEPAIEANKKKIARLQINVIKSAISGDYSEIRPGMIKIGIYASQKVRDWFVSPENNWAENHPIVQAIKESNKPLIDSGALRASITYELSNKNDA